MAECPWPVHSVVSNQDFLNAYDDLDIPRRNGLNRTRTISWDQMSDILLEMNPLLSFGPIFPSICMDEFIAKIICF